MSSVIGQNSLASINQKPADVKQGQTGSEDLRNNFMTLLITQLKNQDPLKPLENAELTSQLAQINVVSGVEDLNSTMKSSFANITEQISASQQLQASQLIGHGVLVPGDKVLVGNGVATPFGVELPKGADSVKLQIVSGSGEVVREYELGALEAGIESFQWDGKKTDGSAAGDGAYKIVFTASAKGSEVPSTTLNYGMVSGVTRSDKGPLLDLGGTHGRVPMTEVREVI